MNSVPNVPLVVVFSIKFVADTMAKETELVWEYVHLLGTGTQYMEYKNVVKKVESGKEIHICIFYEIMLFF